MQSAIIENGVVVNVIMGENPDSIECDPEVSKGWTYSGGTFSAPAVPKPNATEVLENKRAAASLTRAQFLQGCVAAGIITESVADEAATGQWPTEFNTFLNGLTTNQRIDAKAAWADGKVVRRDSSILALITQYQKVTDEQLDALFEIS